MEPLPIATLAGLTPSDITLSFYDDRMEAVAYDAPTDAVAIPVETYTARRAYQIASEYRRRGVPVILGGFHPSLMPDEAQRYGDAIVIGEAEGIWAELIDDLRHGTLKARIVRRAASLDKSVWTAGCFGQALPANRAGRDGSGMLLSLCSFAPSRLFSGALTGHGQ